MILQSKNFPVVQSFAESHLLDTPQRQFLNQFRLVAMRCRASSRLDVFRACDLLKMTSELTHIAYAEALVRTLAEGLRKPARFLAPGADEMTFDERWLLSTLDAIRRGDSDSVHFLIYRRLPPSLIRQFRMMLTGLAREMTTPWESALQSAVRPRKNET